MADTKRSVAGLDKMASWVRFIPLNVNIMVGAVEGTKGKGTCAQILSYLWGNTDIDVLKGSLTVNSEFTGVYILQTTSIEI